MAWNIGDLGHVVLAKPRHRAPGCTGQVVAFDVNGWPIFTPLDPDFKPRELYQGVHYKDLSPLAPSALEAAGPPVPPAPKRKKKKKKKQQRRKKVRRSK